MLNSAARVPLLQSGGRGFESLSIHKAVGAIIKEALLEVSTMKKTSIAVGALALSACGSSGKDPVPVTPSKVTVREETTTTVTPTTEAPSTTTTEVTTTKAVVVEEPLTMLPETGSEPLIAAVGFIALVVGAMLVRLRR